MTLFDVFTLFDPAHGIGFAWVGAFFPFLKRTPEEPTISKKQLLSINQATISFLEVRGVENFKVYTISYDNHPVVLIQVEPQKKLRFSNIIEIQIKKYIRAHLSIEVPAIFWRFKTDYSDTPGPEQADYEFEEQPQYPQDKPKPAEATTVAASAPPKEKNGKSTENHDHDTYLSPSQTLNNMHVEEIDISMGEFDEFLKGAASKDKKDEKQ